MLNKLLKNLKAQMPKDAGWLLPGLQVKRWFALIIGGTFFSMLGLSILFDLRPVDFLLRWMRYFITTVHPDLIGILLILLGCILLC